MSNELAISAVTLTLRDLFHTTVTPAVPAPPPPLSNPAEIVSLTDVSISMQPPHKARGTGASANQINIFLYKTDINAALRNAPPRNVRPGENATPPLALNLEYLITAYGEGDNEVIAQYLLGQVMRVLHDTPVLPRELIRAALLVADLHRQVESVVITQRPLSIEEMSKLWSTFQTHYRLSVTYLVTVTLIDSRKPPHSALPVLRRGPDDAGFPALASAPAFLLDARSANGFPSATLGGDVTATGQNFGSYPTKARLAHSRLPDAIELDLAFTDSTQATLHLPSIAEDANAGDKFPAGVYGLGFVVRRASLPAWTTNLVTFTLAPSIAINPTTTLQNANKLTVTVDVRPRVVRGQQPLLITADAQLASKTSVTPADTTQPTTLTFEVDVSKKGPQVLRLRVDGVDSIPIRRTAAGILEFDPNQTLQVN